jgi:DNA-binding beta-propeller fold protein YncE
MDVMTVPTQAEGAGAMTVAMRMMAWLALGWLCAAPGLQAATTAARSAAPGEFTPTGQSLTPTAAPGAIFRPLNPGLVDAPDYTAGQASATSISPDGKTLLILTSGFNRMYGPDGKFVPAQSTEFVFVFDVSGPAPVQRQAIAVPDSFIGLVWAPAGDRFFVSGGVDDTVLEFVLGPRGFQAGRTFALGHKVGVGLAVKPEVAGLAVSPDGRRLLAANVQNDSVSLIDLATGAVTEQDLRPGMIDPRRSGAPGGTFPRAVAWVSNTRAYVAAARDREIITLAIEGGHIAVGRRIRTRGQPVALLAGPRARLYAALDNTDGVLVLDTAAGEVVETIATAGPRAPGRPALGGAGSNALALSPDGRTLLVTNGGENAVAFVALSAAARGEAAGGTADGDGDGDGDDKPAAAARSHVVGLAPTGWYPTGVAVRPDGRQIYVVNGKSNTGPVPLGCRNSLATGPGSEDGCRAANQYVWQREKAGFLTFPVPSPGRLGQLTRQVAVNNHVFDEPSAADRAKIAFLRAHIRHVIYIVKENRTYDQVLGDLEVGDGDPRLAVFGRSMTPNQHALAREFVDLDAFFDSGESSNTGWNWSLAGRTNDWTEREAPVNYAGRGLQYDQEGDNRNVNVGFATSRERVAASPLSPADPNVLAGARDVAAPDGPDGAEERGYLWDQALAAGLSVRNYGFYGDLSLYEPLAGKARTPLIRDPFKSGTRVFTPAKASLMTITDPYFRGFDQSFPDYWRFQEWKREFDGFVQAGKAPNLMMVRLAHDHTGDFGKGLDGVDTVETELADNDYAVGLVVEAVAHSPFAADTLIFVVEDDAQDGPDHVDAHRAPAYIVGPYVRHGAVISHRYATVDLVATMEAILGVAPMGLNDALARPMADVFDTSQAQWTFTARPSEALRNTALPLPAQTASACPLPTRSAAYWAAAMAGQDFSREDQLDTAAYNLALWRGMKGSAPYPAARNGKNLRAGRARLIAAAGISRCGARD